MWFKNAIYGRLNETFECDEVILEEHLGEFKFEPVGEYQVESMGFVPPMPAGMSKQLVHTANGRHLICLQIQTKIIPPSVVTEILDEKMEYIEHHEGRKVTMKEKQAMKEDIFTSLAPQAFTNKTKIYGFFDFKERLFVINTASAKAADILISAVRKTLGSFPIRAVMTKRDPEYLMTEWAKGNEQLPEDFYFGNACRLKDSERSIASLQNTEIQGDEVKIHVEHGKQIDKLQLTWCDAITFTMQDGNLKSITYLDTIQAELDDVGAEDAASLFDATFLIMAEEVVDLIQDVIAALGGEEMPEEPKKEEDS